MTKLQSIQWNRLAAEAVAIVGSILLAFAIDAKWQSFQDQIEEESFLSSISNEITTNLAIIEEQRAYHEEIITVIEDLFSASDGVIVLEAHELDGSLLEVTFWARSGFVMGAIDSLSQGGSFLNVSDIELRAKLGDLRRLYQWVDSMERREEQYSTEYLTPFLAENAFLPQIASSTTTQFPNSVITQVASGYAKGQGRDHRYLLNNDQFLGMLVQEKWNHEDTIQNFDGLKSVMLEAEAMIDENLR